MIETVRRMVTSCPECDTHFYVKPEQLAARKGFVRCGHCQQRFNALEFMLPEREVKIDLSLPEKVHKGSDEITSTPSIPLPIDETEETHTPTALVDAITSMPLNRNDIVKALEVERVAEIVSNEPVTVHTESSVDNEQQELNPAQDMPPENQTSESTVQLQSAPSANVETEIPQVVNPALLDTTQDHYETLKTDSDGAIVVDNSVASINADFAKKRRFTHKKSKNVAVTSTYVALIIVLILFATAQTLYYCRTAITSKMPQIKPYFEQACFVIGCVIELPKDITKINIDDSDLKEDMTYKGLIRVSATIINQAAVNLAYPNLELTLTDEDNKPLLRRIFKPSEYLENKTSVSLGLPANQETYVNINVSAVGSAVVGYRLLPSY